MTNAAEATQKGNWLHNLFVLVGLRKSHSFRESVVADRIQNSSLVYYQHKEEAFNFRKVDGSLILFEELSLEQYTQVLESMAKDIEASAEETQAIRADIARLIRMHEDSQFIRFSEPTLKKSRLQLQAELQVRAKDGKLSQRESELFYEDYRQILLKNRDPEMVQLDKEMGQLMKRTLNKAPVSSDLEAFRETLRQRKDDIYKLIIDRMYEDLRGIDNRNAFIAIMSEHIRFSLGRTEPYLPLSTP